MTLEDVASMLKAAEAYKDIKLLELKRTEDYIVDLKRQQWWLEHPEVAYFTARTSWETDYGHSEWEQYLDLYIESVVATDGSEIIDPLLFYDFPTLEEDVLDDDERFTTYRNPFLCT